MLLLNFYTDTFYIFIFKESYTSKSFDYNFVTHNKLSLWFHKEIFKWNQYLFISKKLPQILTKIWTNEFNMGMLLLAKEFNFCKW